jgi:multiple sugar transport system substrate-binding protein
MQNGAKRYIRLLPALLVILALGCPGSEKETDGRTVIEFSFWGNWGNLKDLDLWKAVKASFEEKNPDVEVKLLYVTGDYQRKLPLQFISNSAADVILMDDEIYPSYAVRGYLEDLRPYIERDKDELRLEELLPTAMESFTYNGFIGGLPWDGNAVLIFYNKELFEEAGIEPPRRDWTWEDFREIARRLTRDRDGDGRLDQFGSSLNFVFLDIEPIIWSYGGDMLNESRTAFALDTPEARRALDLVYAMKYEDHSVAWQGELEGFGSETMLLTGRVAMVLAGSYMMAVLQHVKGAMDWDVLLPPAGPDGQRYTRVTWDGISLNRSSSPAEKEAGWRFIKHIMSEEVQAMVGQSGRAFPVRREYVLKYWVRPDTDTREEVVLDAVDHARLTPITPKYLEIRNATEQEFRALIDNQITVDEALARMKPKVDKALREELAKWGRDKSR